MSTLQANVEMSRAAAMLIELMDEEAARFDDAAHFWDSLFSHIKEHLVCKKTSNGLCDSRTEKMTDQEAQRFGKIPVPFGEYCSVAVDQVPLDRLCWYADQRFVDELRRYLKSDRIARELESE